MSQAQLIPSLPVRTGAKNFRVRVRAWLRLMRVQTACITALIPVWGALAANPHSAFYQLGILFIIGLMSHLYGFVLNEILDIEFDKQSTNGQDKPLVNGEISVRSAFLFAMTQPLLALAIAWLAFKFSPFPFGILISSILLATFYNVFGKRFAFPPLADIALGTSVGLLVIFGASVTGDLNALVVALALLSFLQVIFNNGIEGGIKDLENDQSAAARTTALWFGVRFELDTAILTNAFIVYAWSTKLIALIVGVSAMFLIAYWQILPFEDWIPALGFGSVSLVAIFITLTQMFSQTALQDRWYLKRISSRHEIATYAFAVAVAAPLVGLGIAILLFILPVVWYVCANLILYGRPLEPNG